MVYDLRIRLILEGRAQPVDLVEERAACAVISARCAKIRARWSDKERMHRRVGGVKGNARSRSGIRVVSTSGLPAEMRRALLEGAA